MGVNASSVPVTTTTTVETHFANGIPITTESGGVPVLLFNYTTSDGSNLNYKAENPANKTIVNLASYSSQVTTTACSFAGGC